MEKKIKVLMYCKVSTDIFPDHPGYMTGKEIFDFLMKDLEATHKELTEEEEEEGKDPERIPGDLRLWYLGNNEKFGTLGVENEFWEWSFCDSNFDRVQEFIDALNKRDLFTEEQYRILCEKIEEGRKIDWMYDIRDYLLDKAQGKVWEKKSEEGREGSRRFFAVATKGLESKGFKIIQTSKTQHTIEMNAEVKKEGG